MNFIGHRPSPRQPRMPYVDWSACGVLRKWTLIGRPVCCRSNGSAAFPRCIHSVCDAPVPRPPSPIFHPLSSRLFPSLIRKGFPKRGDPSRETFSTTGSITLGVEPPSRRQSFGPDSPFRQYRQCPYDLRMTGLYSVYIHI